MKSFLQTLSIATLSISLSASAIAVDVGPFIPEVSGIELVDPDEHLGIVILDNDAPYDLICDLKIIGLIKGSGNSRQEARVYSRSVRNFIMKAGRGRRSNFDFKKQVLQTRSIWHDDEAELVSVDSRSLNATCKQCIPPQDGDVIQECYWGPSGWTCVDIPAQCF